MTPIAKKTNERFFHNSSEKKDNHLIEAKKKIFDKIDELEKLINSKTIT